MRVLLTGAHGFIGRHVVVSFLRKGIDVVAVCRKKTKDAADVEYISCDLLDKNSIEALCSAARATHLLHLAWDVSTPHYWTSLANIKWLHASQLLAQTFIKKGGQRIVGVGTCAEYSQATTSLCEYRTPTVPETLYGKTKLACANSFDAYSALGASTAWARLFYLSGPGDYSEKLIPSACKSLHEGTTFLCKNGEACLDYLDVRDAAEALAALTVSNVSGAINIASGYGIIVRDLLYMLASVNKKEPDFIFETQQDKPLFVVAKTERLRKELLFTPKLHLQDSLVDCYNHYCCKAPF